MKERSQTQLDRVKNVFQVTQGERTPLDDIEQEIDILREQHQKLHQRIERDPALLTQLKALETELKALERQRSLSYSY